MATQSGIEEPAVRVRPARRGDALAISRLAGGLARHVEDPDPALTPDRVVALGFGPRRLTRYLVATRAGTVVGMAAFGSHVDLHMNLPTLYLSDLAVDPGARGVGVGRLLMAALARQALSHGALLRWEVWRGNTTAMAFYKTLGATCLDGEATTMGLEGAALVAMAQP